MKRSRSTAPEIPGTVPELECCQNVHPFPAQLPAGTAGCAAVVQFATQSTEYPFRANQSVSAIDVDQNLGVV